MDESQLGNMLSSVFNQNMSTMKNAPGMTPPSIQTNYTLPTPVSSLGWLNGVNALIAQDAKNIDNAPPLVGAGNPAQSNQAQNTQAVHEGLLGLLNQGFHDTGIPWLYSHLKGGIQGWYSAPGQNDPNPFENLWQGLQGAVQGFENPAQARQNFAQQTAQTQAQMPNNFMRGLVGFNSAMVGDPITYLPGAAFTKPIGWAAKATGVTPAMKYLGDLLGGTLKTGTEALTHAAPVIDNSAIKSFEDLTNPVWETKSLNTLPALAAGKLPAISESAVAPLLDAGKEPLAIGAKPEPTLLQPTQPALADVPKATSPETPLLQPNQPVPYEFTPENILGKGTSTADKAATSVMEGQFSPVINQAAKESPVIAKALKAIAPEAAGESTPNIIAELADTATKNAKKLKKDFGPYATSAWQKAVGAKIAPQLEKLIGPDGVPAYQKIQQALNKTFSVLPGTTKAFQNLYSKYFGNRASGARWINQWLADTFKDTTPEQRAALIHAMEVTPEKQALVDPALEALRQKVEPVMQQAFEDAKSRGLIKDTLDPAKFGVARYLPHIYKSGRQLFTNTGEHLTDNPFLRYGVDANKARGLKGTIKDLNAKAATDTNQPTFEDDALKVIGHYLHQINDAKAAHEFEDSAMGLYKGQFTGKLGSMHGEAKAPIVLHSKNGTTVAMPKGESDILNNLGKKSEDSLLSKGFKKWTNGLNQMMFLSSPLIHVVNNLGFQSAMHDPAILKNMFKYISEARHGIQAGSDMDRALKAGALNLSSEIGARGGSGKQLNQLVNAIDGKGIRNSGIGKAFRAYKQFTPDVEKAYRTAAFMRALDHGMNEQDAAKYVRSIFGGHIAPNTMSKAERALNTVMPFGNWTKTALTSNAKNALAKPQAYEAIAQALNSANQAETGHGMWGNRNPATIGTPFKDKNGNQVFVEPYFPAMDLMKLGKEFASDGVGGGSMNFMWSRANPILKTLTEWATKNQNPFTNDPYSLYPLKTLSPSDPANAQGIFFGNKGPLVNPYVAAAAQNITLPGAQAGYDLTHLNQPGNGADLISSVVNALTGATTTAPKPQTAKATKFDQAQIKADLKKRARILAQRAQGGQ